MRPGRLATLAPALALLALPAGAQPAYPARAAIAWIDVSAVSESGRPVADLAGEDFEVVEAGRAQPLLAFRAPAPAGVTIVLVEDLLVRPALVAGIRDAVRRLVAGARAGDVVLLAAASGVSATATAPAETAALLSQLEKLRADPDGPASLRQPAEAARLHARRLDALAGALAALSGHAGARALVLVGPSLPLDVDDSVGREAYERVMRASQGAAAAVYFLGCGDEALLGSDAGTGWADASGGVVRDTPLLPTTRPAARAPRSRLYEAVAEDTGGFWSSRTAAWSDAVDRVLGRSRARYLLGIASADPEDGRFHAVTVRALRAGVRLHARKGYFAPGQ